MNREIVFIVYVTDIDRSVEFYSDLLDLETDFVSPRYVTFALADGVALALWTGNSEALADAPARTTEVCLNVNGEEVMDVFQSWSDKGGPCHQRAAPGRVRNDVCRRRPRRQPDPSRTYRLGTPRKKNHRPPEELCRLAGSAPINRGIPQKKKGLAETLCFVSNPDSHLALRRLPRERLGNLL